MRPVNLLPARYRARSASGNPRNAYFAVGGLAAVVLAVFVYLLTVSQISSRNAEIERTHDAIAQAESRVAALKSYGDFAAVKQTRLAAVTSLATARVDWERLFRELAHVLPDRVWLTDFSGMAAAPDAMTGGVGSPSILLTGCAATHSRVADAMVRMREVHAAEEVTLQTTTPPEDESDSTAGEGTEDGCGDYYTFEINVTLAAAAAGTPAAGGETVPAKLGGGG